MLSDLWDYSKPSSFCFCIRPWHHWRCVRLYIIWMYFQILFQCGVLKYFFDLLTFYICTWCAQICIKMFYLRKVCLNIRLLNTCMVCLNIVSLFNLRITWVIFYLLEYTANVDIFWKIQAVKDAFRRCSYFLSTHISVRTRTMSHAR